MENYLKEISNEIDRLVKLSRKLKEKVIIYYVANVSSLSNIEEDYQSTSVNSEYLSLVEFESIQRKFRSAGFETLCFVEEVEFIKTILAEAHSKLESYPLVVNSAQKGLYVGRKSLIPAFCDFNKIMYSGSNPYVVSLCRDKFHSNCILESLGLNSLKSYVYTHESGWLLNSFPQEGERIIVKLNNESASIGLTSKNIFYYNHEKENFLNKLSKENNSPLIIQEFIAGYEVELPIISIRGKVIPLIPVGVSMNNNEFIGENILDYSARKNNDYTWYNYLEYNPKIAFKLIEEAKKAVKVLNITGLCRVDFRIDINNTPYITDIATNPHTTKASSFNYVLSKLNFDNIAELYVGCIIDKYDLS